MHFTATAVLATIGLTTLTTAAPTLNSRQSSCSAYPWFIVPYTDTTDCTGNPVTFQPTSGPYDPNAGNTTCTSLSDPNGAPMSFASVSINRDACPQQVWQINLYTDGGCGTTPTVVTTDSCVASPGTNAADKWESFEAIRLT